MISPKEQKARSRRLLVHRLSPAIGEAYKGNTSALCDILAQFIPAPENEMLTELIARKMKPGRKARQITPSEAVEKWIISIVRSKRDKFPVRPLPRGLLNTWINEVATRMGDDGELHGLTISRDNILAALERGKKKQAPKVALIT